MVWSLTLVTLCTRIPSSWFYEPQHSLASLEACKLLRYMAEYMVQKLFLFRTHWREQLRMHLMVPLVTLDTIQLSLETKTYEKASVDI